MKVNGRKTKVTELEFTFIRMVHVIQANGKMINSMEMVLKHGQ